VLSRRYVGNCFMQLQFLDLTLSISGRTQRYKFGACHRDRNRGQERQQGYAHSDPERHVGIRPTQHHRNSYDQLTAGHSVPYAECTKPPSMDEMHAFMRRVTPMGGGASVFRKCKPKRRMAHPSKTQNRKGRPSEIFLAR